MNDTTQQPEHTDRQVPKLALTYEEVEWSLGVPVSTLRRWVSEGRLPCVHMGKRVMFPVDMLRGWLREHEAYRNQG